MGRFERFLFFLQTALLIENISAEVALDSLELVFNPNVKSMIEQDVNVPVIFKVKEYLAYITGHDKKPFWLTTGDSV